MNEASNDNRRSLLLVDDDPLVIKVYAERMKHEGWTVAVARDGWEACQEAGRKRFDMILLDIRMPFHDGVEVLKEIRRGVSNYETPVYILTSLAEGEDVDDALRLGADGVFYKSATRPDELVEQVERILVEAPAHAKQAAAPVGAAASPVPHRSGQNDVLDTEPDFDIEPAESAASAPAAALDGEYDVFVNPFLGDGAVLCRALGLDDSFLCPECGGQVNLRLSASGTAGELVGKFLCGRCVVAQE